MLAEYRQRFSDFNTALAREDYLFRAGRKERYETAYREHLMGDLPVEVATQDFGKDGRLPVFTLRAKEDDQPFQARKYSLNGVLVRRVLAPGEALPSKSKHPRR